MQLITTASASACKLLARPRRRNAKKKDKLIPNVVVLKSKLKEWNLEVTGTPGFPREKQKKVILDSIFQATRVTNEEKVAYEADAHVQQPDLHSSI